MKSKGVIVFSKSRMNEYTFLIFIFGLSICNKNPFFSTGQNSIGLVAGIALIAAFVFIPPRLCQYKFCSDEGYYAVL
jgi:hypothetical protein